jgi:signal transduction histidine kinase
MVSHEFRTPLGVVNTAAHLLGRYSDRMTAEERSTQIREIHLAVGRMAEMMEDLLLHGEFATGKLQCKPARAEVEAVCRRLISEVLNPAGMPRLIECVIAPAAREAFLDEKILRHILTNLLSNAVKYSSDDQPVTLEVKRVALKASADNHARSPLEDHLQLKISDSGIGIPAADLSRLFQTFQRASNVGNRPGTGMGLAIVKQYVDLHGGAIRVESEEGKGTTVWVELPVGSAVVADAPLPPAGTAEVDARGLAPLEARPEDLAKP